jgi:hypothetical protein
MFVLIRAALGIQFVVLLHSRSGMIVRASIQGLHYYHVDRKCSDIKYGVRIINLGCQIGTPKQVVVVIY